MARNERDRERQRESPERDFLKLRLLHAVLFLYQVSSWCGGGEWGKGRGRGVLKSALSFEYPAKENKNQTAPLPH